MKKLTLLAAILATAIIPAKAVQNLFITEVDPAGSSASYGADWFELTNTGTSALDITGWKIDDSSDSFGSAVALRGITSIPAGASVVFTEGTASGTTDSTIHANFESTWFGSNVPSGFLIGGYGGSGVGLSTSGDGVNIFNASGTAMASVLFGNAPASGATFDNSADFNSNSTDIATASIVGLDGAFAAHTGTEVGSPGFIATAVPEPSTGTVAFMIVAFTGVFAVKRHRARLQA